MVLFFLQFSASKGGEMPRLPYSIQERPTVRKPGKVYYIQFRDDKGEYMPARSSGQTSKSAARIWADDQLRNGVITISDTARFEVFAKSFFTEESAYVKYQRARGRQTRGSRPRPVTLSGRQIGTSTKWKRSYRLRWFSCSGFEPGENPTFLQ